MDMHTCYQDKNIRRIRQPVFSENSILKSTFDSTLNIKVFTVFELMIVFGYPPGNLDKNEVTSRVILAAVSVTRSEMVTSRSRVTD